MESQQTVIEHLRTLATEYKSERDHLRKEVAELCKKIKERNASIIKIEEEVKI